MQLITLDFESFWDADYSLSKMTPLQYIMDPRWETQACALKHGQDKSYVVFGQDIDRAFESIDWENSAVLGHNMSGFDALILAYRFGIVPKLWLCTLAMARPIHGRTVGLSLKRLAEHYGLGVKDNTVLLQTRGRRLADFTPDEIDRMRIYNRDDTELCHALFKKLRSNFTTSELWQIDALIRMRTEPEFRLDRALLTKTLGEVKEAKRQSLAKLAQLLGIEGPDAVEMVRSRLASAPQFAHLLGKLGVDVPTKPSKTDPDRQIPALAKTDEQFVALQEHPNELVAAAAAARLEVKSTLLESRIEAFLTAEALAGALPIPIKFCGAETTGRDSGEEYNPQNMNRIDRKKPKPSDALRDSLLAPEGYVVAVADQSGIELRVNHVLWKVPSSMQAYAVDPQADLYVDFASHYYGRKITKADAAERMFGKVSQLGLGFGAGKDTFRQVASVQYGVDLPMHFAREDERTTAMNDRDATALHLDGWTMYRDESDSAVRGWRGRYEEIVAGWYRCQDMLEFIHRGQKVDADPWGMIHTCSEGFTLPSGRLIRYPYLRFLDEKGVIDEFFDGTRPTDPQKVKSRVGWWYGKGRYRVRIYAGKIDENWVQALARDSIFDCAVAFYKLTGYRPKLRVHDELVYIFPAEKAKGLLEQLQAVIRTPPKWWPELVVWSEGSYARCYGECK